MARPARRSLEPTDILAGLDAVQSAIDALRALIVGEELARLEKAKGAREAGTDRGKRRSSIEEPRRVAEPMTLAELGIDRKDAAPEWISPGEAASIRDCTVPTIITLARKHNFGVRSGGRWRVDRVRLLRWMAGEP